MGVLAPETYPENINSRQAYVAHHLKRVFVSYVPVA